YRFVVTFLLFVLMISFSQGQNGSEQERLHYTARHTRKPPRIDGKITRHEWNRAPWSSRFIDIEGPMQPAPPWETRYKLLWDDEYLYVLAVLQESHLWATLTTPDAIIFQDHDFEIFLDPDRDQQQYLEIEINALGTIFDLFMDKPYNKGGKADIGWNLQGLRSAVSLQGTLNDPRDQDTGWIVEMAIPFQGMTIAKGQRPSPGDSWAINFSRVEWELDRDAAGYHKRLNEQGKPLPEHNWVWSPQGVINMHVPERWGWVRFTR
ncbi:MAG: carbohydrate-binding family 9-like protein, partial [Chitinophagaceae bacterium]